ncbi:Heme D1 biosynthesis protein [gamma proteobacterium HdN1]|nr:Heme D1 biosynthesis protein [gamma proteobacterium HdN1]
MSELRIASTNVAHQGELHSWQSLSVQDGELINALQLGLPLVAEPFRAISEALGVSESYLLERIRTLLDQKILSRFGPMFQIERAGGRFTLAAIAAPEDRFDELAATVNAFPEVAHNYERTHALNMWFVLGTETPEQCRVTLARIEAATGCSVFDMPKLQEFRVQLFFDARPNADSTFVPNSSLNLRNCNANSLTPAAAVREGQVHTLDTLDRAIMRATQSGLPLVSRPFAAIADTLAQANCGELEVLHRFERWQAFGVLRRIAAVPDHYALGYVHNGMTVWDVDDAQIESLGEKVAALGFISHCYRRPRHLPNWPYNLFAMVHGRSREQTDRQMKAIAEILGSACRGHNVLWSTRILKKTGLRIAG